MLASFNHEDATLAHRLHKTGNQDFGVPFPNDGQKEGPPWRAALPLSSRGPAKLL